MFVENETRNLDITNFTVEDGGFAHDVDAFDLIDVFQNFFQDMIGGKTKRVIDVEN